MYCGGVLCFFKVGWIVELVVGYFDISGEVIYLISKGGFGFIKVFG